MALVENLVASCRMFRQSVVNFLQIFTWIAYLDFSNKSNMGVLKVGIYLPQEAVTNKMAD